MKVKKYKEFITEGMWKSGLDRAKDGKVRLGDAFTEDDLEFFQTISIFNFKKVLEDTPELDDFTQDIFNDLLDFYEQDIISYINQNGFYSLISPDFDGGEDDGICELHDDLNLKPFEKTYKLNVPKPCKIKVVYAGNEDSYRMSVGDNGDEFDLTEGDFATAIYTNIFCRLVRFIIDDNPHFIKDNLEKNFEHLKEMLDYKLVEMFTDSFVMWNEIEPLSEFDDIATSDDMGCLLAFFITELSGTTVKIGIGDKEEDISKTPIGKKLIKLVKTSYKQAVEKFDNGM